MPKSNPYGAHSNAGTGPAKNTILEQRDGRILKVLWLDHDFLGQWKVNNPDGTVVYRRWFGDENLNNVAERCNVIVNDVRGFVDVVDVVENGYNESHEGLNDGMGEYAAATVESVDRIKSALPGMLVSGGHWSVGTPYNAVTEGQFQDWETWIPALHAIDFHGFHEYGVPTVMQGVEIRNGLAYGPFVGRHTYVYDWLEQQGLPTPPIIIGEFGIDGGGAGQGWKKRGHGIDEYMNDCRRLAPLLLANRHVWGVVNFCCGQNDKSWDAFDLAGQQQFVQLLNASFAPASLWEPSAPLWEPPELPAPLPDFVGDTVPVTQSFSLYVEWSNTDGNQWVNSVTKQPNQIGSYDAFTEHMEATGGGEQTLANARRHGWPG